MTILTISACSSNNDEFDKLKAENQDLRNKLRQIENEIDDLDFSAFGAEKSSTVRLGDEYVSEIGIIVYKKSSPIRIQLGEFIENKFQPNDDTLYKKNNAVGIYRRLPKKVGDYSYGGKVEFDFFDTTIVRYFQMEYAVVK